MLESLRVFLINEAIQLDYGEFVGINTLSLEQLERLHRIVEDAIIEKKVEEIHDKEQQ